MMNNPFVCLAMQFGTIAIVLGFLAIVDWRQRVWLRNNPPPADAKPMSAGIKKPIVRVGGYIDGYYVAIESIDYGDEDLVSRWVYA